MFINLSKALERIKIMKQTEIKNGEKESTILQKKEYIGLNVKITRTFHKMIKKQALEEDTTVADIVKKSLTTYIESKKA